MTQRNKLAALAEYQAVSTEGRMACADPHRLIQMMMERALAKIAAAKGHMARNEVAEKGLQVSGAMSIIDGLRTSLNLVDGGSMAENLEGLYFYMIRRLLTANLKNDITILEEVAGLLRQIKDAWDAIAESAGSNAAAQPVPGQPEPARAVG